MFEEKNAKKKQTNKHINTHTQVLGCFRSRNINKMYVVISNEYLGMINYYLNYNHCNFNSNNNNNGSDSNSNDNGGVTVENSELNDNNQMCQNKIINIASHNGQNNSNNSNNSHASSNNNSNNSQSQSQSKYITSNSESSNSNSNMSKQDIMNVIGCTPYNFILNIKPGLDVTRIDNGWRINGFYTPYLPIVYLQINFNHFTVNHITPIVVPGFLFVFVCVCPLCFCAFFVANKII